MSKLNLSSLTARQKQLLVAGGLVGGILVVSVAGVVMTEKADKKNATPAAPAVVTNIATPGSQIDTKDVWMGRSAQDIRALQDQNKELEDKFKRLEDELKKINGGVGVPTGPSGKTSKVPDDLSNPIFGGSKSSKYPLMPPGAPGMGFDSKAADARKAFEAELNNELGLPANTSQSKPRVLPPPPGSAPAMAKGGPAGMPMASTTNDAPPPAPGIMSVSFNTAGNAMPGAAQVMGKGGAAVMPKAREKNKDNYLPSGTFVRGVLLSGLDAPTGAQAQQNPHPILIRLTDMSVLPNRARFDIKECFITAAGYGDLSSERAYIRTETLSCVKHNGDVIDQEMKGWATGDDGKAGVRGRLVTKQGQVLAAALLAGVASGIGNAFQQSQTTTSISPLGATSTLDKDKIMEAGVAGGVHSSLDMLAKYYIKLAEQLFPVVEIDAARQVEVVISHGMFFGEENKVATPAGGNPRTPATATPAKNQNPRMSQARYEE